MGVAGAQDGWLEVWDVRSAGAGGPGPLLRLQPVTPAAGVLCPSGLAWLDRFSLALVGDAPDVLRLEITVK